MVLFTAGVACLASGATAVGIGLLLLGCLSLLPGGYVMTLVFLAWRRVPGYSYSQLP